MVWPLGEGWVGGMSRNLFTKLKSTLSFLVAKESLELKNVKKFHKCEGVAKTTSEDEMHLFKVLDFF